MVRTKVEDITAHISTRYTAEWYDRGMETLMTRTVSPVLSQQTIATLKELRAKPEKEDFHLYVASLRRNGWTLSSISKPLGVSRSAVNIWETKIDPLAQLPEVEQMPKEAQEQIKPQFIKYSIPEDEAKHMWNLTREASKVRRYTPEDSPSRVAAKELEDLLHYHKERGASLNTLKDVCGVSRRAVAQRLEKRDRENA